MAGGDGAPCEEQGVKQEGPCLLDGKKVSGIVLEELRARIQQEQLTPHLHVITVGEDVGSKVYVKQKRLAAEKTGITFTQNTLPPETSLQELREAILRKNRDSGVHGVIVQLPLPEALRKHEREVLDLVDPAKDVDCFHPLNFGHLALGSPVFLPATPAGIMRLLKHYGIETVGKHCVILGKSNIVGKPLGLLLSQEDGPAATVTLCDQYTEGVWDITRQADILVVAAGKHHLVNDPAVLKQDGQVTIIDVGIHRVTTPEGKTVVQGDVNAEAVRPRCRWLTPVPGGVGPMTVACLLEQVVKAASRLSGPRAAVRQAFKEGMGSLEGLMGSSELADLLARLEPTLPPDQLQAALRPLEASEAGRVKLDDFLSWVFDGDGAGG
uniref:Methenyltetrahydrofolate cyclohydrolase n=1 Tax=Alexandrium catenella TaxID=2925 RepID=A0A7S1R7R4_ALECA|mmetsp:Transcript_46290/g.124365  ORF Transcript_46290/g.124365 Transcript_46290/m.124365 type:complete len:382 (+) Transcript_46290:107-1252(+)